MFDATNAGSGPHPSYPNSVLPVQPYAAGLNEAHLAELGAESAVDRTVMTQRGYETVAIDKADHRNLDALTALGVPDWAVKGDGAFPGLADPAGGPGRQGRRFPVKAETPTPQPRRQADEVRQPQRTAGRAGRAPAVDPAVRSRRPRDQRRFPAAA